MKNILIITAHPTSRNLTTGIAEVYKTEKEKQGYNVEVIDLYHDKQQPFFKFDKAFEKVLTDEQKYYQDKITKANEIVFVYPFWWGGTPAILKNWIDSNLTMGFAARYTKGRPEGLLQERNVRIFTTCGAPKFFYVMTGVHFATKKIWKQTIVEFCGMKFDGYHLFGEIDTSEKKINAIFESVKKIANN
jgi:NAD(P)H dehydrogenase (quinone)